MILGLINVALPFTLNAWGLTRIESGLAGILILLIPIIYLGLPSDGVAGSGGELARLRSQYPEVLAFHTALGQAQLRALPHRPTAASVCAPGSTMRISLSMSEKSPSSGRSASSGMLPLLGCWGSTFISWGFFPIIGRTPRAGRPLPSSNVTAR